MKYQITWRSGSEEVVEGDTWQKALHAKGIPSHQWKLIKRIRRSGPPPTMAKPIDYLSLARDASGVKALEALPIEETWLLEKIYETMLANTGAIK